MEQTCRIMTVATISCNTSLLKPQDLKYDTFILAVKYTQLNSSFCRLCYRKCQCFGTIHFFGIIVAHHETPIQLCAKREVGVVRSQYPVYPSSVMQSVRDRPAVMGTRIPFSITVAKKREPDRSSPSHDDDMMSAKHVIEDGIGMDRV